MVSTVSATEQVAVEATEEGGMATESATAEEGAAGGGTVERAVVFFLSSVYSLFVK